MERSRSINKVGKKRKKKKKPVLPRRNSSKNVNRVVSDSSRMRKRAPPLPVRKGGKVTSVKLVKPRRRRKKKKRLRPKSMKVDDYKQLFVNITNEEVKEAQRKKRGSGAPTPESPKTPRSPVTKFKALIGKDTPRRNSMSHTKKGQVSRTKKRYSQEGGKRNSREIRQHIQKTVEEIKNRQMEEYEKQIAEFKEQMENKNRLIEFYDRQVKRAKKDFEGKKKQYEIKIKDFEVEISNFKNVIEIFKKQKQPKPDQGGGKDTETTTKPEEGDHDLDPKNDVKQGKVSKEEYNKFDVRKRHKNHYKDRIAQFRKKKCVSTSQLPLERVFAPQVGVAKVKTSNTEKKEKRKSLLEKLSLFPKKQKNDGKPTLKEQIMERKRKEQAMANLKRSLTPPAKSVEGGLTNASSSPSLSGRESGHEKRKLDDEKINMKFKIKKLEKFIATFKTDSRKEKMKSDSVIREFKTIAKLHGDEMTSVRNEIEATEKLLIDNNTKTTLEIERLKKTQQTFTNHLISEVSKLKRHFREKTIILQNEITNALTVVTEKNVAGDDPGEEESTPPEEDDSEMKKEKRRKKINFLLKEFLETEEIYVANLNTLEENFIKPLKAVKILSKNVEEGMFKYLNQITIIKNINKMFEKNLAKIISIKKPENNFKKIDEFSKLILSFSHTFKLYSDYVSRYPKFSELLKSLSTNERFIEFVKKRQDVVKKTKNRIYEFESFIITPIQRVPRYKLMIKDLLKNTSKLSREYINLSKASEIINSINEFYNKKTKEAKQFERMIEIEYFLGIKNFILPHRKLLKEDVITRNTKSRRIIKVNFILFTDLILVFPVKKSKKPPFLISLVDSKTKVVQFDEDLFVKYFSHTRRKLKKLHLAFPAVNTCKEWLDIIKIQMEKKRVSSDKTSKEYTPMITKKRIKSPLPPSGTSGEKKKTKKKFSLSKTDFSDYDFLKRD